MTRGRFITIEGGEGAGKSTLAKGLTHHLAKRGIEAVCTREPGGTPLAEKLRALVLHAGAEKVSPLAETTLMFAARAIHLDNVIRPALARGAWVICDRFTDATYAYQGAARGVSTELLAALARHIHADLWPDRTLLLDLPVALGAQRARQRGAETDRFETESTEFFQRVREAYLARAAAEPQRVRVMDATLAPAPLLHLAIDRLADLLP